MGRVISLEQRQELLGMDRGIRRIGLRLTNESFNILGHAKWKELNLEKSHHFDDNATNREINNFIKDYYKNIRDVYTYRHHLEALEVLLDDFELKAGWVHSYDGLIECLKYECEDQLVYSKEPRPCAPSRYLMVSNFLASQICAPYSGYAREWGADPDCKPFLDDPLYLDAAKNLRICSG